MRREAVGRNRRRAAWEHTLRLTLPWWPPLLLWQARGSVAGIITPELLASTSVVLAGEYLLLPRDVPWRRLVFGVVPLVQGILLLIGSARLLDADFLGWFTYSLAALGWGSRAGADVRPVR